MSRRSEFEKITPTNMLATDEHGDYVDSTTAANWRLWNLAIDACTDRAAVRAEFTAIAEAVREAAAKVCDEKEEWYDKKESHKWAEQQTSAMEGCGECSVAIRTLPLADIIRKVTP